ncbi:MAG: hypothetical protein OXG36_14325 [Caldilineaceae bacterium]|nr:hypothetical protein [Caldilineaceae bacterium]
MPANATEHSDWHDLIASAARLQREVLVGGTAVALLARHRYSTDADHVVTDLTDRYDQVRRHLESLEGWATAALPVHPCSSWVPWTASSRAYAS